MNFCEAEFGTVPPVTTTDAPTVVSVPEHADPVKYSYVTVPAALNPPVIVAESVTELPTRIDEDERLVATEVVAIPTAIVIVRGCDVEPLALVIVIV